MTLVRKCFTQLETIRSVTKSTVLLSEDGCDLKNASSIDIPGFCVFRAVLLEDANFLSLISSPIRIGTFIIARFDSRWIRSPHDKSISVSKFNLKSAFSVVGGRMTFSWWHLIEINNLIVLFSSRQSSWEIIELTIGPNDSKWLISPFCPWRINSHVAPRVIRNLLRFELEFCRHSTKSIGHFDNFSGLD